MSGIANTPTLALWVRQLKFEPRRRPQQGSEATTRTFTKTIFLVFRCPQLVPVSSPPYLRISLVLLILLPNKFFFWWFHAK